MKSIISAELTVADYFDMFVTAQAAKGVSDATIRTYHNHFASVSRHLNTSMPMEQLRTEDLQAMIASMRASNLAHNSISSYARVVKTFINWANKNGFTEASASSYKQIETVKDTYTDDELLRLLKRPKMGCTFAEFRNWVIIQFLINCGCRSSTLRNIQNQDVDLERHQVVFRHMKTGKLQMIPLCSDLVTVLHEYMRIRAGTPSDPLFCNEYGEPLTKDALYLSISKYNKSRGVYKTSVHAFRHTFAKKYLVDCGGNAFTLQRLLGHSTLDMTRHYCRIYDADICNNFDNSCPLTSLKRKGTKTKIKMK